MKFLVVLFDPGCRFCVAAKAWLKNQEAYVPLTFVPVGSEIAEAQFPELKTEDLLQSLTVVSDEGGVYQGTDAYIMVLYALKSTREWASYLARPRLKPYAHKAFEMITQNRHRLGHWLGQDGEKALVETLRHRREPVCSASGLRAVSVKLSPSCSEDAPLSPRMGYKPRTL